MWDRSGNEVRRSIDSCWAATLWIPSISLSFPEQEQILWSLYCYYDFILAQPLPRIGLSAAPLMLIHGHCWQHATKVSVHCLASPWHTHGTEHWTHPRRPILYHPLFEYNDSDHWPQYQIQLNSAHLVKLVGEILPAINNCSTVACGCSAYIL